MGKCRRATRKEDGRNFLLGSADSSVDQEHRSALRPSKRSPSIFNPANCMDSGFLEDEF